MLNNSAESQNSFVSMNQLRPVVLSGPSGSGKSTLLKLLMSRHNNCFAFTVSHTTRPPRPGETPGKDYHYVARDEMQTRIGKGEFVEHAEFAGNLYGTSVKAVQEVMSLGKICILDVDLQGVRSIKKLPELCARFISIQPPTFEILEKRLRGRGTETEEKILSRLARAREELEFANQEGMFDLRVVNDDPEIATNQIEDFLLKDLETVKANSQK